MSKNDVWGELMERLKQKAKSDAEIKRCMHLTEEQMQTIHKLSPKEIQNYLDKLSQETKWVKLEDVLSELKKLQENHIVIEKKKFKDEIVFGQLSTNAIINDLHERIEEIIKNFVSFKASFIEELLRKNAE